MFGTMNKKALFVHFMRVFTEREHQEIIMFYILMVRFILILKP